MVDQVEVEDILAVLEQEILHQHHQYKVLVEELAPYGGGGGGGGGGVGRNGVAPAGTPYGGPGGLGRQVPSTFRDPASGVGAPGPTGPVPADNPGGDQSGRNWFAGGGGGGVYDPSPLTSKGGRGGGGVAAVSTQAGPYAGGGNGGVAESAGMPVIQEMMDLLDGSTLEAEEVPMETRIQDSMVVPVSSLSHTHS